MKYFINCKNLEDLKKEYRKLALKYHPDRNQGNDTTKIMQEINSEYEKMFNILKNVKPENNTYDNNSSTSETASDFINIINELIKYNDINIEIVGSWLWVSGEGTRAIKEILKSFHFFWNNKRTLWQLKPETDQKIKFKNSKESDEQIKNRYGCEKIKTNNSFRPVLN